MRLTNLALALVAASTGIAQAVAAPAATAPASAAPTTDPLADPANAMARLKAADVNNDGKWDKAEWLAAGRREMGFVYVDADKDGFVTTEELETAMAKLRAMRGK